ncbi:Chitinase [hydrothermal vent metagenome]|uniref:Chitinase n=1 Tax=hydrothermal vent metagenome TaxID=652676 RepID=A0A1W1BHS9_9ZZZZ
MKRLILILVMIATVSLTSCGGGSSEEAKELLSQILTIVGIPQDMIVNICQDENDNGFCDSFELESVSWVKNSFLSKVIVGEDNSYELKDYDPTKKIIMELQSDKVEYNDGNFSLEYKGTSRELSILQSMVDNDDLSNEDVAEVKKMDGKDTFDDILLSSMMKNLNGYMHNDMGHKDARYVNLKELGRVLKDDIPLKSLPTLIKKQCNGDKECIKELIKNFSVNLSTDTQSIYTIAQNQRKVKLLNDKLIEKFTCRDEERKIVRHYGFEDIFNLKNRDEYAHPTIELVRRIGRDNLANYDSTKVGKFFAENVKDIPRKFRNGRFYIGLKKSGSRLNGEDRIHIGNYTSNDSSNHFNSKLIDLRKQGWSHQSINSANPTTEIYYTDFDNIQLNDKNDTLLDYLDIKTHFDVVVENTAVDFISVATCAKKDPEGEIKQALNIFRCKEGEKLIKLIGGNVDAFAKGEEKEATPSDILLASIDRPTVGYDELADNKFFLDTLKKPTDLTITNAQFSVGIKPLPKFLYQNDTIHLGSYESDKYARFKLYGNDKNSVYNMWSRNILISNGERVLQTNLSDINLTNGGTGSLFDMLKESGSALDILIQNDTSVDFSYLNMCVK